VRSHICLAVSSVLLHLIQLGEGRIHAERKSQLFSIKVSTCGNNLKAPRLLHKIVLTRICDSADPTSAAGLARLKYEPSTVSRGINLEPSPAYSEDFRDLVHTQLSLLLEILRSAT